MPKDFLTELDRLQRAEDRAMGRYAAERRMLDALYPEERHVMHFKIFPRWTLKGRRWYFHLKAKNGEIVAHSEGYVNRLDCLRTVQQIQAGARSAPTIEKLP